ncbi:MAG: class I SAM-dependent methyltransferase [Candidatus Omnitrophica bacterium]|nr:class I SAM-dependent methyltransferase [Candidatus Omnitrophota bacterium]
MTKTYFRTEPELHNTQFIEAMAPYHFAGRLVGGKRVLDAGCSFGYGSDYLSKRADEVVGLDNDRKTIIRATNTYRQKNVRFVLSNATGIDFPDSYFDVACLFELIHQVAEYQKLLEEIHRVLKNGGILLVSTRRKDKEEPKGDPSHIKVFTAEELKALLGKTGFSGVETYGITRPEGVYELERELAAVRKSGLAGIKKLIPRRAVPGLVYLFSRIRGIKPPQELKCEDFKISADAAGTAPGILAVCKKI